MNAIERGHHDHSVVIARFADVCRADDRIIASLLCGSVARGEADQFSDLDLCLITTDEAFEEVTSGRRAIIEKLGMPLFLEDFGRDDNVFFILSDGTEGEILFGRESRLEEIHVGPHRTLLDKKRVLERLEFPLDEPDRDEQVEATRRVLFWFWHELSHFIAGFGRGQLWWAYGQIEALRRHCVNLVRIEHQVEAQEEAYEKLEHVISTTALVALQTTICPMEPEAMLRAALHMVSFYRERAPAVAQAHGLTYPTELAELMGKRLDDLARPVR